MRPGREWVGEELSYKKLRDMLREEKTNPALIRLPEDYYPSVAEFLSKSFSSMEASRSVMQMREFENATAIIREHALIRRQKILFKALRSGGAHGKTDEMTREEHETYDRFCGIVQEEDSRLGRMLSRFESRKKAADGESTSVTQEEPKGENIPLAHIHAIPVQTALTKVRFIKEMAAYIGANKERLGPFRAGEEGLLPKGEAELLLKEKAAELLQ
jgi:DNA replication initiation complex subunit (GINS family)